MKIKPQQVVMASIPVVAGLVFFNIMTKLAGNSVVGKVLNGSIVRG